MDRLAVRRALAESGMHTELREVEDIPTALAALERESHDLLLLDFYLPGGDGLDVLKGARKRGFRGPIIVLTGRGDEQLAVELMKAGASDYVPKGSLTPDRLAQSLRYALAVQRAEEQARRAEQALRENRRWLATTLRSIGDAVLATDEEGKVSYLNPMAEALTGWRQTEAAGKPLETVLPLEGRSSRDLTDVIGATGRGGEGFSRHFDDAWLVARDGARLPLDLTASQLRNDLGEALGVVVAFRDVTERVEAEQALHHYAEQLRGLMETSLAVNATLSVDEVLRVVTEQARAIVGTHQAVATFVGEDGYRTTAVSFSDRYAELDPATLRLFDSGVYDLVCARAAPVRLTQGEIDADTTWQPLARQGLPLRGWLAAPLVGKDGTPIGLIQLSDKIQGELTEDDEAILVQLAQMASGSILNADLFARAQRAVKARDNVLAVVSHDLRNPLNVIVTSLYLLQARMGDDERSRTSLESIQRASQQMKRLLDDLLDASRIEAGRFTVDREAVPVEELLDEVLASHATQAELAGVEMALEADPSVPKMWADRSRLLQVFANLVGNALKAVERGGAVRVHVERRGDEALFAVADTGRGIAAEDLPHIFDAFWQSRELKTGGSGLGLAIARGIVQAHGGEIWAESEAGEGARFFFTVPLQPSEAADLPADAAQAG